MGRDDVYRVNSPQVISEDIEGELVMINLERGTYYSAEGSGAAIWKLVEAGLTRGGIVAAALGTFAGDSAEIEAAVHDFIDRLLREELIVPCAGATAPAAPAGLDAHGAFVAPALQVYSDMADILLLDPVHDVDETGWPKPKSTPEPA